MLQAEIISASPLHVLPTETCLRHEEAMWDQAGLTFRLPGMRRRADIKLVASGNTTSGRTRQLKRCALSACPARFSGLEALDGQGLQT